jgi:hypothetical protein
MEPDRVTRREMLRKVGLAGAAAWAAPVLTSARASASVDRCTKRKSHGICRGTCCDPCFCGTQQCGTCSSDVGDGSFCMMRYGDLKCFCAEDVFCSEAGVCTSDADCKAQGLGNVCITQNGCTGCGSSTAICSTRCCTPLNSRLRPLRPRRLGRTAAGR